MLDAVNRRTDLFSGDVQQDSAEFYVDISFFFYVEQVY